VRDLRELSVPASTLATLVKRNLVAIEDVPENFHLGGLPANGKKHATSTRSTRHRWRRSVRSPPP